MSVTISEEQKKSLAITAAIFVLLFLMLIFIKFASEIRIQELAGGGGGGVTVNFGDSEVGSGADYRSEVLNVSEASKQVPTPSAPEEEILSQESDDAVSVAETKKPVKTEVKKVESKVVPEVKKTSKSADDALANMFNSSNKGGDGDDGVAGNKGKANGDKNSSSYYGDGGSGGGTGGGNGTGNGPGNGSGNGPGSGGGNGGGYSLGNRKALTKPDPKYVCNETGKVVVEVTVDRTGKTIGVVSGVKGTTNTAKCLADQAKIAAMNTRWQADEDAPEKQVGRIVYTFSLN